VVASLAGEHLLSRGSEKAITMPRRRGIGRNDRNAHTMASIWHKLTTDNVPLATQAGMLDR